MTVNLLAILAELQSSAEMEEGSMRNKFLWLDKNDSKHHVGEAQEWLVKHGGGFIMLLDFKWQKNPKTQVTRVWRVWEDWGYDYCVKFLQLTTKRSEKRATALHM